MLASIAELASQHVLWALSRLNLIRFESKADTYGCPLFLSPDLYDTRFLINNHACAFAIPHIIKAAA